MANASLNGDAPQKRVEQLHKGYYVVVNGVSPMLVDQIQASVPDPEVPVYKDEETGRDIPNPTDPRYHKALEEAEAKRNRRAIFAVVTYGLELSDKDGNPIDIPDDPSWEFKLKLTGVDWVSQFEETFDVTLEEGTEFYEQAKKNAFLLLEAISGQDMDLVNGLAGLEEEKQAAVDTFQRP